MTALITLLVSMAAVVIALALVQSRDRAADRADRVARAQRGYVHHVYILAVTPEDKVQAVEWAERQAARRGNRLV